MEIFLHQIQKENVTIMFDAFDEISEKSREIIVQLIKILREKKIWIWITTRPNAKSMLKEFGTDFFYLTGFSIKNQLDFIESKCSLNTVLERKCIEEIKKCKNIDFTVPMHLAMTTEFLLASYHNLDENTILSQINLYLLEFPIKLPNT